MSIREKELQMKEKQQELEKQIYERMMHLIQQQQQQFQVMMQQQSQLMMNIYASTREQMERVIITTFQYILTD